MTSNYYLPGTRYAAIHKTISELLARDVDITPCQITAALEQNEDFSEISYVLLCELRHSERERRQVQADNANLGANNVTLTDQVTTLQNTAPNRRIKRLEDLVNSKEAKISEYDMWMDKQRREIKELTLDLEEKSDALAKLSRDQ